MVFTNRDFNFGYLWLNDGDIMWINHLWLDDDNRGYGRGSAILETLFRMAYYEGARVVEVSIGGGQDSEEFLERNGFHIIGRRYYELGGESTYGVDAVRSTKSKIITFSNA